MNMECGLVRKLMIENAVKKVIPSMVRKIARTFLQKSKTTGVVFSEFTCCLP